MSPSHDGIGIFVVAPLALPHSTPLVKPPVHQHDSAIIQLVASVVATFRGTSNSGDNGVVPQCERTGPRPLGLLEARHVLRGGGAGAAQAHHEGGGRAPRGLSTQGVEPTGLCRRGANHTPPNSNNNTHPATQHIINPARQPNTHHPQRHRNTSSNNTRATSTHTHSHPSATAPPSPACRCTSKLKYFCRAKEAAAKAIFGGDAIGEIAKEVAPRTPTDVGARLADPADDLSCVLPKGQRQAWARTADKCIDAQNLKLRCAKGELVQVVVTLILVKQPQARGTTDSINNRNTNAVHRYAIDHFPTAIMSAASCVGRHRGAQPPGEKAKIEGPTGMAKAPGAFQVSGQHMGYERMPRARWHVHMLRAVMGAGGEGCGLAGRGAVPAWTRQPKATPRHVTLE